MSLLHSDFCARREKTLCEKIVLELNCSIRREKIVNGGRGRMSGTAVPKSFCSP